MEIVFGIVLVGGIILMKSGIAYWQMARLSNKVAEAQEAMGRQDWADARRILEQCVKMQPGVIPVRHFLAIVLAKSGDLTEAEGQFKFALDLEPKRADSLFSYGLFLAAHYPDRYAAAAEMFLKAIASDPNLQAVLDASPELGKFRGSREYTLALGETKQ